VIANFTYDGDGRRVKSVMGSEITLFVGAHYEVTNPGTGQTVTKYYFAGSQRIAMRKYVIPVEMTVEYLFADHLGSTSLTTDADGVPVSQILYNPWGEVRYSTANPDPETSPAYEMPDYTFTGQFSYTASFGLMFFNARWVDVALGRFAQADSVTPGGVQGLDRYAFVNNNPIRYTDPSGHVTCTDDGYCAGVNDDDYWTGVAQAYNVTFAGSWAVKDKRAAILGVAVVASALGSVVHQGAAQTFSAVFRALTFTRSAVNMGSTWGQYGAKNITFYAGARLWTTLVAHELGHAFNAAIADRGGTTPYGTLSTEGIWVGDEEIAGDDASYTQDGTGIDGIPANHYRRTFEGLGFHHSVAQSANEDFADTFANWTTGSFSSDSAGRARMRFMTVHMTEWVSGEPRRPYASPQQ
jgi:RHS repeat-associated protein